MQLRMHAKKAEGRRTTARAHTHEDTQTTAEALNDTGDAGPEGVVGGGGGSTGAKSVAAAPQTSQCEKARPLLPAYTCTLHTHTHTHTHIHTHTHTHTLTHTYTHSTYARAHSRSVTPSSAL
jgi:hypothetical protein